MRQLAVAAKRGTFSARMSLQLRRNSLEYLYHNIAQNPRELLRLSGMPVRTFNRNMAKLRSEHHLTRVSGSGRPRIFKGDSQRQVVQFARRNPMWSAQRIANAVANKTNTLVSSRTIQRSLQRAGYIKLLPKKVPMLTPRHKQLRVEFSQRHRRRKFRNVFITDECMFQLHRNTVRQWCKSNQRPMKQVPKFAPSVMVWGALSCKGFYLKVLPTGTVKCQVLPNAGRVSAICQSSLSSWMDLATRRRLFPHCCKHNCMADCKVSDPSPVATQFA